MIQKISCWEERREGEREVDFRVVPNYFVPGLLLTVAFSFILIAIVSQALMALSGRRKKCGHILILGAHHMQGTVEATFVWLSELEVRKD